MGMMPDYCSIFIGFDPREAAAFAVCYSSIKKRLTAPIPIRGLILDDLIEQRLYKRDTEVRNGRLWDVISNAPMATEFAISRFLVPRLAGKGWALFLDADMLARVSLTRLFELADPEKAVMVVKHNHNPEATVKMDGQQQTQYARKNWSSVMLFNCEHPANKKLTVNLINKVPGRDLHGFCWLKDKHIGELNPEWNYLIGHTKLEGEPKIVHFTDGIPTMKGYENVEYANEFWDELKKWAAKP